MKLLITMRDVGATVNIIEVIKQLEQYPHIEYHLLAQAPSISYLEQANIHHFEVVDFAPLKERSSKNAELLLEFAKNKIASYQPDAILTGLSSPRDAGIDEAIISVAPKSIPTFVFQDFWGEINTFFDSFADLYFCLDEEAVNITKQYFKVQAISAGSPRHINYSNYASLKLRTELRDQLCIKDCKTVLGLFGQSLHFLKGYHNTISDLLETVKLKAPETIILFRPHPRETAEESLATIEKIKQLGLQYRLPEKHSVAESLIICDTVCSIFSNCIYDACYLNYFSKTPLITPVLLGYEKDIIAYAKNFNVYEASPYKKQNLAYVCKSKKNLENDLGYLLSSEAALKYTQSAKNALRSPKESAKFIIKEIINYVDSNYRTSDQDRNVCQRIEIAKPENT